MSYSIVFETKIVRLSDGRIIHFDRSGCNNDNCGRHKDEFSAKIYTEEDFVKKAEAFKKNSKPYSESDTMELKIGSRYATMYDYGEHLLRMLKRAKSYFDFVNSYYFVITHLTGVELLKPEHKIMSVKEFDNEFYKLLYNENGFTYARLFEYPDIRDERNLIRLIEKGETLSFEIRKRR